MSLRVRWKEVTTYESVIPDGAGLELQLSNYYSAGWKINDYERVMSEIAENVVTMHDNESRIIDVCATNE